MKKLENLEKFKVENDHKLKGKGWIGKIVREVRTRVPKDPKTFGVGIDGVPASLD